MDLEYAVQMLQVMHGGDNPRLRTPSVHEALDRLAEGGFIRRQEAEALVAAYRFQRSLINALRMLRGSAQDLFLPAKDSIEFSHLARRMGYSRRGSLPPETSLFVDFETASAGVRAFVERYFGQSTLPGPGIGNVADLVLAEAPEPAPAAAVLTELGFAEPERALRNLRSLAGPQPERRELFARLAILACDILSRTAAPDMALNNWERFVEAAGSPEEHYRALLAQPMGLDILLRLFASSQFLSDTLIRNPAFLPWLTDPGHIHALRDEKDLAGELRALADETPDAEAWRDALRRFRRREILRTGVRDLVLGKPLPEVTTELTRVADAITRGALERIWATIEDGEPAQAFRLSRGFCVVAFGKLGGRELNYSSDIDLFALYQPPPGEDEERVRAVYDRVMERLRDDLARHTAEGGAYRVDLRLRPWGSSGMLVYPLEAVVGYYEQRAALWEVQALLKARPIAGSLELGDRFLQRVRPLLLQPRPGARIAESIERMRGLALQALALTTESDIKSGLGGIRDLEFLIQGLQLAYRSGAPRAARRQLSRGAARAGVRGRAPGGRCALDPRGLHAPPPRRARAADPRRPAASPASAAGRRAARARPQGAGAVERRTGPRSAARRVPGARPRELPERGGAAAPAVGASRLLLLPLEPVDHLGELVDDQPPVVDDHPYADLVGHAVKELFGLLDAEARLDDDIRDGHATAQAVGERHDTALHPVGIQPVEQRRLPARLPQQRLVRAVVKQAVEETREEARGHEQHDQRQEKEEGSEEEHHGERSRFNLPMAAGGSNAGARHQARAGRPAGRRRA